jgi:hypothetical protein
MRLLAVTAVVTLFISSYAEMSLADSDDGVRASYFRTTDLPDEIAFRMILTAFDDDRPELHELTASALNIPLNDDTRTLVSERVALFQNARKSMQDEGDDTSFQMLCSSNGGARTREDTYAVLNDVDDVRESIAKKHYLLTISALSMSERQAFHAFLNKKKTAMSYSKIDSRTDRDEWEDIRMDVERQCTVLVARRNPD